MTIPRWGARVLGGALGAVALAGLVATATAAEDLRRLTPRGRVSDFAGVMTPEAVARTEAALAELERRTGAQVAVVAVSSVPDGDVDRAAVDLFRRWGIGQRGKDNGVLILCAIQDRRARIEVGYGLEGVIPDAVAGRILDTTLIPAFRRGEYSAGLVNTALAVAQRIAQDARVTLEGVGPPSAAVAPLSAPNDWLAIVLLFTAFVALAWFQARRQRKGYRGGWWWYGGGGYGGTGGGGFGGFGGGGSGGGGASRGW